MGGVMESLIRNLSLYGMLNEVDHSSKLTPSKKRESMIKVIEFARVICDKPDSEHSTYSRLLEDVVAGEKTFTGELKRVKYYNLLNWNIHIFGRHPRNGSGLEKETAYLDRKIAELYHAKN